MDWLDANVYPFANPRSRHNDPDEIAVLNAGVDSNHSPAARWIHECAVSPVRF